MDSPETIASRISEYIQARPNKIVSGTDLAQFLKFTFPDFSPLAFGVPKLRLFLQRFVPGIAPVGRTGGDLLYGVRPPLASEQQPETRVLNASAASSGPPPRPVTSTAAMSHQLWKSFSSPNSLWHIYANSETGEIQVIAPGNPGLSAPWVVIPPLPAEIHAQVIKSFIATLPDEKHRNALQSLLLQPRWWDRIYAVTLQLGLLRDWQFHRRREILRAFSDALRDASIPARQKPSILPPSSSQPNSERTLPPEVEHAKLGKDERLRRAVISAVEKMSVSELRILLIPVGYLADELRRDG